MVRSLLIAIWFTATLSLAVSGAVIHVPDDYSTIQGGIDAAVDGDTVLVQPGTYEENINFNGRGITLGSLFLTSGDPVYIAETIIDGGSDDTVVKFWSGESASITGFTIRGGYGEYGGGISCRYSSPLIADNIITRNSTVRGGGGIFCWSASDPAIINNTISDNSAPDGGGLWICYSHPTIEFNTIVNNSAVNGGGIAFQDCDQNQTLRIANNLIIENRADQYGGAIYSSYSVFNAVNNTVAENSSSLSGKGLYLYASNPIIVNTVFWGNGTPEIYAGSWSNPEISYSDIQGNLWQGEGNMNTQPRFRDPDNGDFHLMAIECGDSFDSPCIDNGSPEVIDGIIDCDWGMGTVLSDMGAYGGRDSIFVGIPDHERDFPTRFQLAQNFPNPFNAQTTIGYELPFDSYVGIEVYDLLGRFVETLVDSDRLAGSNLAYWDAADHASGTYFYKIQNDGFVEIRKMSLLK